MKKTILLALLLLSHTTYTQDFKQALDKYFEALEASGKVMFNATIAKDGVPVYQKSIGLLDIETSEKSNTQTLYRIGSITKVFTATMIFQLIDEKKLSLETTLSDFFPQIPNASKITIEQLLGHRSGIHDMIDDPAYWKYMEAYRSHKQMIDRIAQLGSDFAPDSRTQYSNSGYVILGYIIEEITGESFEAQLQQRICAPIGLKRTSHGKAIKDMDNHAISYEYANGKWQPFFETHMSIPHGAGAIVSTSTDIAVFMHALFAKPLISQTSLEKMTEIKGGHGHGIFKIPVRGKEAYGHNGSIDAFISDVIYIPKEKLSVAVTTNGLSYDIVKVMSTLLRAYENMPIEIPKLE